MEKDSNVLLHHARLFLEEGQSQLAYETLERVEPENEEQQREIEYLRAWGYILDTRWDEAGSTLKPLVSSLEGAIEENGEQTGQELHRERHGLCLFYLGDAAVNLGHYEDASRHYTRCLRLLQDRRVQSPKARVIRIKARYALGTTFLMRGSYTAAKQHYDDALKLYNSVSESCESDLRGDLAAIYYGFCTLYWRTGNLLEALQMGKNALNLYKEIGERSMVGRMHNQLGYIYMLLGEFHEASEHFTDALAIATASDQPKMIMLNCSALAQLRVAEGRLQDAMDYCELALESMNRSRDDQLTGIAYLTMGKVMQAVADSSQGEQKHMRLKEALQYFEQACSILSDTQAYEQISEAYGKRAEVLEMMGRAQEAVDCWRSAVKAQGGSYGATWD